MQLHSQPLAKFFPSTLIRRFLLLCLLLPANAAAADWFYTLRPNDSLTVVAEKFCGDAAFADRIAKHNRLDQRYPPAVGSRVRIPVDWLVKRPAPARLVSVQGTVTRADGTQLVLGDTVSAGQRIDTGDDGLALVAFADGSTLEIGSQARVVFDILSAFGDAGMVDTLVRFQRGRGVARVIKQSQGARFRVSTPTGIAAVRGTEFRIAAEGERALLETTEGSIGYDGGATQTPAAMQTLVIDAGYGAIATPNGATREELLPAPDQLRGPSAPSSRARFSWAQLPGATEYNVTLYRLSGAGGAGVEPIEVRTQRGRSFRTGTLEPGTYQVSVRGVAASGLQGMDAQAQAEIVAPQHRPWWMLGFFLPLLAI